MSDTDKKKAQSSAALAEATPKGSLARAGDTSSARLRKVAGSLGNDELQKRIEKGNASRDQLMQFLAERLKTMRKVQLREMKLTGVDEQRKYWKKVADSQKPDYTKPEPTRWRLPAQIYEEAARQLARGAVDRGRQLVEKALSAEKDAFKGMGKLVHVSDLETEPGGPELDVVDTTVASATDVPPQVEELVRKIENVTEEIPDFPNKKRGKDPWWTLEEEEEEEEPQP